MPIIKYGVPVTPRNSPERFKGLFLSEGLVYLSAVVLMEIGAGAHSKEVLKAVQ